MLRACEASSSRLLAVGRVVILPLPSLSSLPKATAKAGGFSADASRRQRFSRDPCPLTGRAVQGVSGTVVRAPVAGDLLKTKAKSNIQWLNQPCVMHHKSLPAEPALGEKLVLDFGIQIGPVLAPTVAVYMHKKWHLICQVPDLDDGSDVRFIETCSRGSWI